MYWDNKFHIFVTLFLFSSEGNCLVCAFQVPLRRDADNIVSLEKGPVYMPNCKSFLVTEAERKHVRRRARFQQHRDASCKVFFFFLQGKALKEIYPILTAALGEHAQFKRVDFSTCNTPRPGRPKTVSTREIIDQIHKLLLEDHRISAKSKDEQLSISREGVGPSIHEDLDMRKLSAKWVPKCLNADQKRQRCLSSEQLLEFFRHGSNKFLSRLVTMDETWLYNYDPETKQQSM